MQNALTAAIQSMHNDHARLEGIARNLANVSTSGYKRETAATTSFGDVLRIAAEGGATQAVTLPRVSPTLDTRGGSLRITGEPLDLAIEGDGFFEIRGPQGNAYTRQGRFQVDPRGRLVTEAGDALLGRGAEITVSGPRPVVERDGTVVDNGRIVGRIKLVRVEQTGALERLGSGLHRAAPGAAVSEASATVRQGYLENSNVSAMTEMVRLIETTRHFEAAQKVVQAYDEMLEKALRKLGEL